MKIIDMLPSHRALVASSWLQSYAQSPYHGFPTHEAYLAAFRPLVDHLLDRDTTKVMVMPDDEDAILGWACHARTTLHYVYVKSYARDALKHTAPPHLAKRLVESIPIPDVMTFRSRSWERFAAKHGLKLDFKPLFLRKAER